MQALEVKIKGIVQGVGFRPFIHRQVRKHGLRGTIRNTSSGVTIELEGEPEAMGQFLIELPEEAPPLAVIEEISKREMPMQGFDRFSIIGSERQQERNTLISPDIAVCEDCLQELNNPTDRRFHYPFINCTNCGPRFTIIEDVPYDRPKTSMKAFPMCPDCEREYHDIENRRYHAQPDCCPDCGPEVSYLDGNGKAVPGDAIEQARTALKDGRIIAIKGLGGFHLACRCDDPAIASELRRRKHRDEKPFAIMCRNAEIAEKICILCEKERKILCGARKPIVLLKKRDAHLDHLSENAYLGIMLPYTPLHVLLFGNDIDMLVMTSANLSDTPIIRDNEEAVRELQGVADGFLIHNRLIQTRCDDSLCWVLDGGEYFVRRSRGYVPQPVTISGLTRHTLACGAEQKASFCLGKGEHAFQSQHIGDLKNLETLEHYEDQIRHFERLFDIHPLMLACDLHPDYLSTRYAQERAEQESIPLLQVQHHHAHMASCMADNRLSGACIGLVWDGTGLGTDGSSWGAECLVGDYRQAVRMGSILPIPLIGGDRAAKEPYRVAYSLLEGSGCETDHIRDALHLKKQLDAGLNCPLSSGMGRLFDGVAAILGIKEFCNYEGQAAILLEALAGESEKSFPVEFIRVDSPKGQIWQFDWRPMIRELIREKNNGAGSAVLSAAFMNTVIRMAVEQARLVSEETGLKRTVLSGGSFQNQYLMSRLPAALRSAGLDVYHHRRVSCNDEGLSLGQLMIANQSDS